MNITWLKTVNIMFRREEANLEFWKIIIKINVWIKWNWNIKRLSSTNELWDNYSLFNYK